MEIADLVVCILDRPRHAELIAKVREAGARIMLIGDGDVSGVMATSDPETGIDIYMGSGGAPEGVLAAAALRCIGGQMQGRLLFRNDDERGRAHRLGINDLNRKYGMLDMAHGDVMFAATGVTNGSMLKGVRRIRGRRVHAFGGHALEDRHGALRRGEARFHAQAALRAARPLTRAMFAQAYPSVTTTHGRHGLRRSRHCRFLGVERSVCGKRWRVRRVRRRTHGAADRRALGCRRSSARLLGAARHRPRRGPAAFLAPRLRERLPDPAHLRDMAPAVARLVRAIRDGEPIVVFGDYDVDGATSAALLLRFFAAVGARASVYVPDRLREGYGPNAPALLRLKAEGAAVGGHGRLRRHRARAARCGGGGRARRDRRRSSRRPSRCCRAAVALINPNRLDETSPHGALAAVGVAFLLVVALNRALREAGWYGAPRRARPAAMARPGGARHGVRRRAADRAQPRAGGAGHPGGARQLRQSRACARWPRSAA